MQLSHALPLCDATVLRRGASASGGGAEAQGGEPSLRRGASASHGSKEHIHMSQPHGPLQGVRVVTCSTAQAGTVPYTLMADLGADVIKIEVPDGGDSSRRMTVTPGMPSTFFATNNRGDKSVNLNLKAPGCRA